MHSQALSKIPTRYWWERPAGRGGCWGSTELPSFGGMQERSAATVGKAGELASSCPGLSHSGRNRKSCLPRAQVKTHCCWDLVRKNLYSWSWGTRFSPKPQDSIPTNTIRILPLREGQETLPHKASYKHKSWFGCHRQEGQECWEKSISKAWPQRTY